MILTKLHNHLASTNNNPSTKKTRGPNPSAACPYKRLKGVDTDTHNGSSHMNMEAEMEVMLPQPKRTDPEPPEQDHWREHGTTYLLE